MINQKKIKQSILLIWIIISCICSYVAAQKKESKHNNLSKYLNEKRWNELFPNRFDVSKYVDPSGKKKTNQDFYSFRSFLAAADSFPQFLSSEDTVIQKRELCAFLASIAFETGGGWDNAPGGYYKWGLYFTEEKGCENGCKQYNDTTKLKYLPQPGQSYHGRGPMQISWNYNYGQFSATYFHDKQLLLKDPALISKDAVTSFASALWFWTTAQYPKPSCHDIICETWKPSAKDIAEGRLPGFGTIINIINGGIECNGAMSSGIRYRYGYYLFFCKYFHVDPGPNIECGSQKPFGL